MDYETEKDSDSIMFLRRTDFERLVHPFYIFNSLIIILCKLSNYI